MNFLILSYEQSRYELLLRLASLHGLDINDPDEAQLLISKMSNVFIDDSGATTLNEMMGVVRSVEEKHGIKIHWILIDYIQLVSVEDKNNPGRFVTNQTQAMVEISKRIKSWAKTNEIGFIFLSQVPKEVSGNGNTMLYAEDMKDSQALQACADWIFTAWRPNKDVRGKIDNILSLFLCKHKHITNSHKLQHHYFENGRIMEQAVELVDVRERRI